MNRQQAVFLDGWSPVEQPVSVELDAGELHVTSPAHERLRTWSLSGLRIDAMQEGDVVHVSHDDVPHEQVVIRDPELAAQIMARGHRVARLPGGENKLAYGLACLLALGGLLAIFYVLAPRISLFVARRVPLEQERALGGEIEVLLHAQGCESEVARKRLGELAGRLADEPGTAFRVHVMHSDTPNAFALPGGSILVTTSFLEEAQNADEIAGVIAHEVEHITQRHVLAGALRGTLLTALWSVTLGDYSGLMMIDPSTAYQILNLSFSREDEQAADDGAVARLHAHGYSHRGLQSFFERLAKKHGDGGPAWLSTHPSTDARIAALAARADVEHAAAPLSPDVMDALRNVCSND